ncbi:MAG TPA: RDD family protein, partial [Solirubrobacteraceae bacterium]|nr:RDD family protein [Solirubrobacteraceae bacterium]
MSSDQGMTSGDPLQPPRPGDPLSPPPEEEQRHESGLPGFSSGYSSSPPPGAVGGSWASSPAVPSSGQYALAGWWSRVGAALIDGLILFVGWIVIMALFGAVFSVGFFASEETGTASLVVGLMLSVLA